jgi:hypothetical protein
MDNIRIPKKVLNRKFYERRPVGRPRLRWKDISKESSLVHNVRGLMRLAKKIVVDYFKGNC